MVYSIDKKQYEKIAEKLRKARIESGFTQVGIAKKIKRPQSFISKIESGEQKLDILELQMFGKIYKKEIGYFLK